MDKILIAEDERVTRLSLCRVLQKEGFAVFEAANGMEAVALFKKEQPNAAVIDLKMPVMGGIDALKEIKGIDPDLPIIIITAYGDVAAAVETMKLGAYDFLTKPVEPGKLILTVKRALEKLSIVREVKRLHAIEETFLEDEIGRSPVIKKIISQIKQLALSDFSVIIQGETGTGKTILAKIIHNLSRRAKNPFVRIDLGALPETLVEGEVFGFERGAFTGAVHAKKGFFEVANGGTVFIDDLENLSPQVQSKILNLVDSKEVLRLGSREPINVNVRIISASNKNIQGHVRQGNFREDLFYRLGEFILTLPPLRERKEDISFFAKKFVEEASIELNKPVNEINKDAMDWLLNYKWPGNIRELKNVLRRAVLLAEGGEIAPQRLDLLADRTDDKEGAFILTSLKDAVSSVESRLIKKTLDATKGNKAKTASILCIDVKTLRSKMSEYGIE